jgi:transcriptional regulator with XRE-family HTH domain
VADNFGDKLRYLRVREGLTQAECANKLGLEQQSHISNLEKGRKSPSLELAIKVAEVFRVTLDYLLMDRIPISNGGVVSQDYQAAKSLKGFARNLQEQRIRANLTQVELVEQLGNIRQWHISHLETGSKRPSIELVLRLSAFFKVSVDELLAEDL